MKLIGLEIVFISSFLRRASQSNRKFSYTIFIKTHSISFLSFTEELIRKVATESYATERFRVIGPLQNSPDFARDFNCSQLSSMNRKNKCIIWWKESRKNGKRALAKNVFQQQRRTFVYVTVCALFQNWKKFNFKLNKALWKRFSTLITDVADFNWHWFDFQRCWRKTFLLAQFSIWIMSVYCGRSHVEIEKTCVTRSEGKRWAECGTRVDFLIIFGVLLYFRHRKWRQGRLKTERQQF